MNYWLYLDGKVLLRAKWETTISVGEKIYHKKKIYSVVTVTHRMFNNRIDLLVKESK